MKLFQQQCTAASPGHTSQSHTFTGGAPSVPSPEVVAAVDSARQLASHVQQVLDLALMPCGALQQLSDHGVTLTCLLLQLLVDCQTTPHLAPQPDTLATLGQALGNALHEALLTTGASLSALHRARQAAGGGHHHMGHMGHVGGLQLNWKKQLAWLQAASAYLVQWEASHQPQSPGDRPNSEAQVSTTHGVVVVAEDLTSVHAAMAWVMQCSVALHLQQQRLAAAAGGDAQPDSGAGDDGTAPAGSGMLQRVVEAAQTALAGAAGVEAAAERLGAEPQTTGKSRAGKRQRKGVDVVTDGTGSTEADPGSAQQARLAGVQQCAALLSAACQHVAGLAAGEALPMAGQQAATAAGRKRRRAGALSAAAGVHLVAEQLSAVERQLRWLVDAAIQQPGHGSREDPQMQDSCCVAYAALAQLATIAGTHPTGILSEVGAATPRAPDSHAIVSEEALRWVLQRVLPCATQQPAPARWPLTEQHQAAAAALLAALSGLAPGLESGSDHPLTAPNQEDDGDPTARGDADVVAPRQADPQGLPLHLALLEAHVASLAACCPPVVCGSPPPQAQHGARSALVFDLEPGSWACVMRTQLLASLRRMVCAWGASRFRGVLLHVQRSVESALPALQSGRLPPQLAPSLHVLLLLLEADASPSMTKVLTGTAHDLTVTLSHLLVTLGTATAPITEAPTARTAQSIYPADHPLERGSCMSTDAASYAAVAFVAARALESLAGRPLTFQLSDCQVSTVLATAAALFPAAASGHRTLAAGHAALSACCSLLSSCLRHRPQPSRGSVPLVVDALRGMMAHLMDWAAAAYLAAHQRAGRGGRARDDEGGVMRDGEALAHCAAAMARVYEALVHDKEHVGAVRVYCMHLLADYITHVGMALPPHMGLDESGHHEEVLQPGQGGLLPPAAASCLRAGALLLLGALGPRELQALHAALGPGWGGARRGVLAALRREWERSVKFTGKV